jgi:GNAT superfamily N-acetyltransferase
MIQPLDHTHISAILAVVNDGAEAYRGVIPPDRWHEPYMPKDELRAEMAAGVAFLGEFEDEALLGVIGLQRLQDVCLIRHAYVRTSHQGRGVGSRLMAALTEKADAPLLVGTWAAATWAIGFYEKHGFRLTEPDEKTRLLKTYWTIPDRQIETSVVLAEAGFKPD